MNLLEISITVGIVSFIVLMVWSKLQNQRIYDTVMEIRDILNGLGGTTKDKIKVYGK
jgi:hypothetical protein